MYRKVLNLSRTLRHRRDDLAKALKRYAKHRKHRKDVAATQSLTESPINKRTTLHSHNLNVLLENRKANQPSECSSYLSTSDEDASDTNRQHHFIFITPTKSNSVISKSFTNINDVCSE